MNKHELIVIEYALVKLHTHLLISIDELYGYEGGGYWRLCTLRRSVLQGYSIKILKLRFKKI